MPDSICSICLRKLLASNLFRKQCLSAEFELKKLQTDHNERKLLKEIESRMHVQIDASDDFSDASNGDGTINIIEYIDDEAYEVDEICDMDENSIFDSLEKHQDYDELKVEVLDINEDEDGDEDEDGMNDDIDHDVDGEDDGNYQGDGTENYSVICSNDEQNEERFNSDDQSGTAAAGIRKGTGKRERKMCLECGKLVVNLRPHMETHQKREKRRKPYKCSYCGKEFLQRAQFDGHVNKEHTGEKPFACDQCGKKFHGRPTLRMHKIQHTNERRFACEYCDKRYRYAHHLSHHRYTHTQMRQFTCNQCDYTNVHRENLRRHISSHHPQTEQQQTVIYVCTLCSRQFSGKSNMIRHQKLVHKMHQEQ